jgi:hypothetical protein
MNARKTASKEGKRVLVASSLNAGAESMSPVARNLRDDGHNVRVISYRAATESFRNMGIEPDRVMERLRQKDIRRELRSFSPDSLLTGTQVQDDDHPLTFEQMLWSSARSLEIPSVAVLDTRSNIIQRFSDMDPDEDGRMRVLNDKRLIHLPTRIAVLDKTHRLELMEMGFPAKLLVATGNPYYEHVGKKAGELPDSIRSDLLSKPVFSGFDPEGKLVVFFSDSIEKFYPDIGFSEKSVLQSFMRVLDEVANETGMPVNLIVRPHPFRNENASEAFDFETPGLAKVLHNPISARGNDPKNEYGMEALINSANFIVGTFNNPLETGAVMGATVISYVPDMAPQYGFQQYLVDQGSATRTKSESDLQHILTEALKGMLVQNQMEAASGAIKKVSELVLNPTIRNI